MATHPNQGKIFCLEGAVGSVSTEAHLEITKHHAKEVPFPKWVEKFVFRNNVCSLNSHFRICQNSGIFSLRIGIAYPVFLVFKILLHQASWQKSQKKKSSGNGTARKQ